LKKTLLIDGNNLLKIGIHGVKDFFHNGKHIGGIWHFLNTTRRFIEEQNFDKVVVMWDGENNSGRRKLLYPQYKQNPKQHSDWNEVKEQSFHEQKQRIKQYLEEMFVRQVDIDNNEADDLISYYCQISTDENITIFSGDKDLTQLISPRVSVYSPNAKKTYKMGDMIKLKEIEIPHWNIKTYKILSGDKSDNIDGIYYLGEKTLVKLFPEILENEISVDDILIKAEKIFESDKNNSTIKNLLTGKTKTGIYGQEFFIINKQIIDLSEPLITEEGKEIVELYYKETLDPDGRGYRNLIRMMMEDGFFKYLPKGDDNWVNFITPFLKLTRKEKRNYKQK
jgi:5'-3' exonuclease